MSSSSPLPTTNGLIPTVAPSPVSRPQSHMAAIISGATIGGILSFTIFLGLFVVLRRRQIRRRQDGEAHPHPAASSGMTEPYMLSYSEIAEAYVFTCHPSELRLRRVLVNRTRLRGGKTSLSMSRISEATGPMHTMSPTPAAANQSNTGPLPLPVVIAELSRMLERLPISRGVYEEGPPSYRE